MCYVMQSMTRTSQQECGGILEVHSSNTLRSLEPFDFIIVNRQEKSRGLLSQAFAGVLNYLLCRRSALKILQHMSERSEFVLQNLWF